VRGEPGARKASRTSVSFRCVRSSAASRFSVSSVAGDIGRICLVNGCIIATIVEKELGTTNFSPYAKPPATPERGEVIRIAADAPGALDDVGIRYFAVSLAFPNGFMNVSFNPCGFSFTLASAASHSSRRAAGPPGAPASSARTPRKAATTLVTSSSRKA